MKTPTGIRISKSKLAALFNNNVKSAEAINLVYVTDKQQGITRANKNNEFVYLLNDSPVKDEKIISRIKSLVLPPAWQNVWICPIENGHLQATGFDARNRKQYKYHAHWNMLRNETKFHHLLDFGNALPSLRRQLQKDLGKPGLPQEKVLAAIISVMQSTCIRIGNSQYEQLYGSFGLTTLKDKHVNISGATVRFSFKGKKGVLHDINLKSKRLAAIIKQCRDIPGKELFQYYDETGSRHAVDSGMVNNYIKQISGGQFTAKDFRTWEGSLHAIAAFRQLGNGDNGSEIKKNIVVALDMVAKELGNTRTVCKKYYVHPGIISLYENNMFAGLYNEDTADDCSNSSGLTREEQILMTILGSTNSVAIAV